MLCTCAAILAVDFPLFPRRQVKTESFGVSLMDAGVGFVVLSSGVVSKQARAGPRPTFWSVAKSTAPLLVLGFVRFASVRAVDYQLHVSEYGVHCKIIALMQIWHFIFIFITFLGGA
jgi:glucosaminylphosphatidylinositol acyltransferase